MNFVNETELDSQLQRDFDMNPWVFMISFICFVASNLAAFMLRLFKNSISFVNLNIIILINYYIAEFLNSTVVLMVHVFT